MVFSGTQCFSLRLVQRPACQSRRLCAENKSREFKRRVPSRKISQGAPPTSAFPSLAPRPLGGQLGLDHRRPRAPHAHGVHLVGLHHRLRSWNPGGEGRGGARRCHGYSLFGHPVRSPMAQASTCCEDTLGGLIFVALLVLMQNCLHRVSLPSEIGNITMGSIALPNRTQVWMIWT